MWIILVIFAIVIVSPFLFGDFIDLLGLYFGSK
jgi:hypothetical protein